MAKKVIKAAVLKLGGVDYSAQVRNVELAIEAPAVDVTNMSSGGWNETLQGIKAGSLTFELVKDDDLSGLDSAIWTAFTTGGGTITFEVKVDSAATSTTNPAFSGTASITQWNPVQGAVGAAFGGSVTWPTSGTITRATA